MRVVLLFFLTYLTSLCTEHKVVVVLGDGNRHYVVHPGPDDEIHLAAPAAAILPSVCEASSSQHAPPSADNVTLHFVQHVLTEARDAAKLAILHALQGGPDSRNPDSGSGSNDGSDSNSETDSNNENDSGSGSNDGSKSKLGGARAFDVWYEFQCPQTSPHGLGVPTTCDETFGCFK